MDEFFCTDHRPEYWDLIFRSGAWHNSLDNLSNFSSILLYAVIAPSNISQRTFLSNNEVLLAHQIDSDDLSC